MKPSQNLSELRTQATDRLGSLGVVTKETVFNDGLYYLRTPGEGEDFLPKVASLLGKDLTKIPSDVHVTLKEIAQKLQQYEEVARVWIDELLNNEIGSKVLQYIRRAFRYDPDKLNKSLENIRTALILAIGSLRTSSTCDRWVGKIIEEIKATEGIRSMSSKLGRRSAGQLRRDFEALFSLAKST